jgi:ABC-type transporter Mla subunit MlaD
MGDATPTNVDDGRVGPGILIAAVILVVVVVLAIWYANSGSRDTDPVVTVTANTDDPGTETTIAP